MIETNSYIELEGIDVLNEIITKKSQWLSPLT
jgi:hypothetical protein